jgi:hypothetical protein
VEQSSSAITVAATDVSREDQPAPLIEVALDQRQGLIDPQAGAPEHDDQTVEPVAV